MYFAIKWPKAMASLALPGAIDAVREKKIIAVCCGTPAGSSFGAHRVVRKLFAGDVGGKHQPALGDREDRHPRLVVAVRRGILRSAARFRGRAISPNAGGRARGDG